METTITKRQLRERLGLKNDAALADFLEITRSAVYQWDEDSAVPELRVLQAFRRRPAAFPEFGVSAANDPAQVDGVR